MESIAGRFGFDEGFNFNSPDGKTIVSVDTEEAFRNQLTRLNDDEVKVTLAGIPAYMEKRDDEIQGYRMTKNGIDYRISLVTTEYSAFFPIFQKMVDSLIIETSNLKPGITTFNDTEERLSFNILSIGQLNQNKIDSMR